MGSLMTNRDLITLEVRTRVMPGMLLTFPPFALDTTRFAKVVCPPADRLRGRA